MDSTQITIMITIGATAISSLITWLVSRHFYARSKTDIEGSLEQLNRVLKSILNRVSPTINMERLASGMPPNMIKAKNMPTEMDKIGELITSYAHDNPIGGIEDIITDLKRVLEWLDMYHHWRITRGD